MKTISKTLLTTVLSYSIAMQMPIANAQVVDNTVLPLNTISKEVVGSKTLLIKKSYRAFKKNIDSGKLTPNDAITGLTNDLLSAEVSVSDLDAFVKENASRKGYKEFRSIIDNANVAFAGSDITPQVFGSVAAEALTTVNPENLAWSGCAGLGVGVVLILGAVVVGIVALVKTKGESRIKAQFQRERSNRESTYLTDVEYINNRPAQIDQTITKYEGEISYAQQQIAVNTGIILGADPSTETGAAAIKAAAGKIQQYNIDINDYQTKIQNLQSERNLYSNPAYAQGKISELTKEYNADLASLNLEEARKIELIPANKALAGKLGIAAGIAGAIGIYLVIDGRQDCK